MWLERAVFGASVFAIGWLLGPAKGIVDAILGPAADATGPLTWLQDLAVAPEDAFVRIMTALGLVIAVRLTGALLLALVSWIPGPTAAGAARLGRFLAPPLARRYIDVIIGISLTSGTGIALTAPAIAATHPAATVVPAPVLAPPEATLQTWPDLGRPGTDVPSSPAPTSTAHNWPDLGRPGRDVPTSPAPRPTGSPEQPSNAPRAQLPVGSPDKTSGATRPTNDPTIQPRSTTASRPEIVVAPGDCLWTLAERDLQQRDSTEPSDSEIAAVTEKWWLANRAEIGANPDRLLPGQRLHPPA